MGLFLKRIQAVYIKIHGGSKTPNGAENFRRRAKRREARSFPPFTIMCGGTLIFYLPTLPRLPYDKALPFVLHYIPFINGIKLLQLPYPVGHLELQFGNFVEIPGADSIPYPGKE